jgi:hypothetical protein
MKIKPGDILVYLGGDTFLDNRLTIGDKYTIDKLMELDKISYVVFVEINYASYKHSIDKHFRNISKEREIKLNSLLN